MKYKKRTFIIACRTNTVMTYLKVFVKRRQYYGNLQKAMYDLYVRCYVGGTYLCNCFYR